MRKVLLLIVCCALICSLNGCIIFTRGSSNEFRSDEELADEMIESKQSAKKINCLCGMNENKEARKKTITPAFELSTWNERKPSVNLYGWNEIKMYHKKELLQ